MEAWIKIPALALLGLHLTGCSDLDNDGDASPWIEADAEDVLCLGGPLAGDLDYDGGLARGEYDGEASFRVASPVLLAIADDRGPFAGIGLRDRSGYLSEAGATDQSYDHDADDPDGGYGLDPDERSFDEFERELGDVVHPTA